MNVLEKEMIEVLKDLRDNFGAFEIKAEFEAEGSRMDELMRLKDVIGAAGYGLIIKTGGVEAITDIYNALLVGVCGIIAPMAESAYAVSKFLHVIDAYVPPDNAADIEFAINIETETACRNFDSILNLPDIHRLQSITVGRGDLVESMGMPRNSVDDEKVFTMAREVMAKAKSKGLKTAIGGSLTKGSINFISRLHQEKLLDKYETRKVVFRAGAIETADEGIERALLFELLWLKSKRRFYHRIRNEDEHRIDALEKRLKV